MFHKVWESERFQSAKVTFKVIGTGAIRWATYDFLLVFHCVYHFRDINITYFPKFKKVTCLNTSVLGVIYYACTSIHVYQSAHET